MSDIVSNDADTLTLSEDLSALLQGGETYRVRAHMTLSALFGAANETGLGEGNATTADTVAILDLDSGTAEIYYYQDTPSAGWRRVGDADTDQGQTPIFPVDGFTLTRRQPGDLDWRVYGEIKQGVSQAALELGNNVINLLAPITNQSAHVDGGRFTLGQTDPQDIASGLAALLTFGSDTSQVDQVILPNASGGLDTFYRSVDDPSGWRLEGDATTDRGDTLIPPATAVVFEIRGSAFMWQIPQAFRVSDDSVVSATGQGLDRDGDGMSDVFEDLYGGALEPLADLDDDGTLNLHEYRLARNPRMTQEPFYPQVSLTATQVELNWFGVAGIAYQVTSSSDLLAWMVEGPEVTGADASLLATIDLPTQPEAALFWRLEVLGSADLDGDYLNAWEENALGTDPTLADTDGDGLSDGWERWRHLDPTNADEDGNGIVDGEDDFDGDGVSQRDEFLTNSDPFDPTGTANAVVWQGFDGTDASYPADSGSTVTKSGTDNDWNADAESDLILRENGRLSFGFGQTDADVVVGLSSTNQNSSFETIDYAFKSMADGTLVALAAGQQVASFGSFSATDSFAIERVGNQLHYLRNGLTVHVATLSERETLRADVSIFTPNAAVSGARFSGFIDGDLDNDGLDDLWEGLLINADLSDGIIDLATAVPGDDFDSDGATNLEEFLDGTDPLDAASFLRPVQWRRLVDTDADYPAVGGSILTMIDPGFFSNGDDGGAVSDYIMDADGEVYFSVAQTNQVVALGLSERDRGPNLDTIAFAIVAGADGTLSVVEAGVLRGQFGSYQVRDTLSIRRRGLQIDYLRNGVVFYSSSVPSDTELLVDASIQAIGASLVDAKTSGFTDGDIDDDGLRDSWEQTYFGDLSQRAEDDPDVDGFTNLEEYYSDFVPTDFYNDSLPSIAIVSGNFQITAPGVYAVEPLVVEITSGATGHVLNNAPVTFDVITGAGQVALDLAGTDLGSTLSLMTDGAGQAFIYFQSPLDVPFTSQISVTAGEASDVFEITTEAANDRPVLTIDTPASGYEYTEGDTVVLAMTATDLDGTLQGVEVFRGGALLGLALDQGGDSYTFTWAAALRGSHVLVARAIDERGATATATIRLRGKRASDEEQSYGMIVGGFEVPLPPGSEVPLTVPFSEAPTYRGRVEGISGSKIEVSGEPDWNPNRFADDGHYLFVATGALEGSVISISKTGAGSVSVTSASELDGLAIGDEVRIIPFTTLKAGFPLNETIVASPSTTAPQTEVAFADKVTIGLDKPFSEAHVLIGDEWYETSDPATITSARKVLPGTAFAIRNPAGSGTTQYLPIGHTYDRAIRSEIITDANVANDSSVGLVIAEEVSLLNSGLVDAGIIRASIDLAEPLDVLLVFDHEMPGPQAQPAGRYFFFADTWRDLNDPAVDVGEIATLKPATHVIVRRGATGGGPILVWKQWPTFTK